MHRKHIEQKIEAKLKEKKEKHMMKWKQIDGKTFFLVDA